MSDDPQLTTRQKILDVAGDLFFRYGFRAVGVDRIVRESGIAKMTLYRYFQSKDNLIVAYLEQANRQFQDWLEHALGANPGNPREQLLDVFAALQILALSPRCIGCAFLITVAEFPELESPAHQAALAHKRSVMARFVEIASQAGARQPESLADQLYLLMEGVFATVRMFGPDNPAANVTAAARALIAAQF